MAEHKKTAIVIGGGLGGLATAALLAKAGYKVDLFEKNAQLGGRANVFEAEGFTFDMGPSWYLMPDVFAHFFAIMGERVEDYLDLQRLDPSYRIYFKDEKRVIDVTGDLSRDIPKFEAIEPGVEPRLRDYLQRSENQYGIAMQDFIYKNYDSVVDFFSWTTITNGTRLHVFEKMEKYVKRFFKTEAMRKIMEYNLVFLGSSPYNTPALYNIMSHVDFNLGVYYPQGGIYTLVEALVALGKKHGVHYHTGAEVTTIMTKASFATGITLRSGESMTADVIISNGDIYHTEEKLLPPKARSFSTEYWKKRTVAPSAFILYLGVEGRIPELTHHNLIFSQDWPQNFAEIFDNPIPLPTDPSLYVCAPSVTDPSVAPKGMENLFVLVPSAAGFEIPEEELEAYAKKVIETMETTMAIPFLKDRIKFQRIYSAADFTADYFSYQGTALGLAHTLDQSAIFRPNTVSKKLKNLYYVGANTNPGIGMPMCLISAELVLKRLLGRRDGSPLPNDWAQQAEK